MPGKSTDFPEQCSYFIGDGNKQLIKCSHISYRKLPFAFSGKLKRLFGPFAIRIIHNDAS